MGWTQHYQHFLNPKPARCEVCKVECTSKVDFDQHQKGKKHQKNIEKLNQAIAPLYHAFHATHVDPYSHHIKYASYEHSLNPNPAWCEVCKVECNSEDVLNQHKTGKKHQKNVKKLNQAFAPSCCVAPSGLQRRVSHAPHVDPYSHHLQCASYQPPGVDPGASASSLAHSHGGAYDPSVAYAHHLAAIYASGCNKDPNAVNAHPNATGVNQAIAPPWVASSGVSVNSVIGPLANPDKGKAARKKAKASVKDLEAKRRKIMEGGAAADAVRLCTICNVVCNSELVYACHMAGKKHASMMKKHAVGAGAST
ncbi:uncharacterized protein LOC130786188 [Actinidia eriantha]|uniref:uncharacterized protein LOC130786188 n=1 Tax=Actinidia eriantha TaxID=165200 RepID=UPI00258F1589|nr:uncharacterized protein LOC130786188 [Actinidia eriantha]